MMTRTLCARNVLLGLVLITVLVGCEAVSTPAVPTDTRSSVVTPVGSQSGSPIPEPTATLAEVQVWISAAVPEELRDQLKGLQQSRGIPIKITDDPSTAHVRLEAFPERALTEWIYVVVAPFPTITDGISFDQLSQIWAGRDPAQTLAVSPQLFLALQGFWGAPAADKVDKVERAALLDHAWSGAGIYSIVPFHVLEPRWKVIELDSQSPIRRDFQRETYPLRVSYGLSGDPAFMADIARQLDWPGSNYDPEKMTVVLMTGVSALTRATAWRMNGKGVEYPGLLIGDWMREADFTHLSHEVAFSEDCPLADPGQPTLRFCADPDHFQLLRDLEVDLVELTGNHVMDWKAEALLYTLDLYHQNGMQTFGGGRDLGGSLQPVLVEHHGNRIAWFGCNAAGPSFSWARPDSPGSTPCSDERVLGQVSSLAKLGYLPIFTFQWGESESITPLPFQVDAFQQAAEAGAVIVQGSQAHRPQTMAFAEGSFIHYGLGNLFFDQMQTWANRQEFLDRHVFYDGRHISTQLLTAILEDYAQPRPTSQLEREAMLAEIFAASGWQTGMP